MRDQPVPRDPFFSAPCGTAGGSNRGAVDAPQPRVDGSHVDVRCAKTLQDAVERAVRVPLVEQVPNRLKGSELFGKIAPRRPASQYPENGVDDLATIFRRPPRAGGGGKQVADTCPLVVRESMSHHPCAPWRVIGGGWTIVLGRRKRGQEKR